MTATAATAHRKRKGPAHGTMRRVLVTHGTPSPPEPSRADPRSEDSDRSSVTDVNGTVARFEMSYAPPAEKWVKFGPPLRSRIPSALYLVAALILGTLVLLAYGEASTASWLFRWIVEGDRNRPLPASVLSTVVVASAIATVLRTHMRGVIVSDDGIEARYLLSFGIPRTRRWAWAQINRVVMDGVHVALELWDGSYERLPEVQKGRALTEVIVQHAQRRKIDITVLGPTRS